jgi:hypothetical protein
MAYSAPHLSELVYGWDIPGDEVALFQPNSEVEYIPKGLAIDIAHAQGKHLVPEFRSDAEPVSCNVARLALPLRWEGAPGRDPDAELDEELWFIGFCGERDLLTGNPHTFHGRRSAWCPTQQVGYNVSLNEITEMSTASQYFIKGFLSGNEPPQPEEDDDGNEDPDDLAAWLAAIARFGTTGNWLGRWRTCDVCGCVLLPGTADEHCFEHQPEDAG